MRAIRTLDFWAIIGLIAVPLIYYFPITLGQKAFSEGDILWIYFPTRVELARALAENRLPLWTPGVQAGLPLFADGHVTALYPLNLLFYKLVPAHLAFSYTILFNLIWTSLGMYACVRASGFQASSAFVAGLAFGFNGYVLARVSHLDVLTAVSWFAWLIFFQQKYWQAKFAGRPAGVWLALSSAAIGLQFLSGSPQISLLNVATFALLGGLAPLVWGDPTIHSRDRTAYSLGRIFARALLITLATIFLGTALAAIQLLPTFELLDFSLRNRELGRHVFSSYALDPLALTQFLSPFAYLGEPSAANMEFWGYLGALPILLALLAPLLRRDFRTVFLSGFGLLMLVLALGDATPLYASLYDIPLLNRFRVPARFLLPALFAITFLAATSFDELQKRLRDPREKNWRIAALGALGVGAFCGIVWLAHNQPVDVWLRAWKALPLVLIGLSIALLVVARWAQPPRSTFALAGITIVVCDLALFAAPFLSNLTQMSSPDVLIQSPRTVRTMDATAEPYRVFANRFPAVTLAAMRATMWSGLPLVHNKQGIVLGYMPFSLALQRNEEFIRAMSLSMRNLINIRYYLLPLEILPPGAPSPFDEDEPNGGVTMRVLAEQPAIPPTRATQIEITSYVDQARDLPDGFLTGELFLDLADGARKTFPIRIGIETADWAYDALSAPPRHSKPTPALAFPAYLSSVGREFNGHKYVARHTIADGAEVTVISVGTRTLLPEACLTIEQVVLRDQGNRAVSLSSLLQRNDLALVFRSHTAAMWENRDVLPRAFIVHQAEIVPDDQTLARLAQPDFRPDQIVLLSDGAPLDSARAVAQADVQIEEYKSERVVIRAATNEPGYLVLTDAWYPGWEASVDGASVPIRRADYMFRAVRLEPGTHRVVFEYHPLSFTVGAWISGISAAILVVLGWLGLRR